MTEQEHTEIIGAVARLEGKIETLTARLDASIDRSTEETRALFASRRELERKVEDIRVDYVPRKDFTANADQNREDHAELGRCLAGLKVRVAMWSGGLSLAAFILGLAAKAFGVLGK